MAAWLRGEKKNAEKQGEGLQKSCYWNLCPSTAGLRGAGKSACGIYLSRREFSEMENLRQTNFLFLLLVFFPFIVGGGGGRSFAAAAENLAQLQIFERTGEQRCYQKTADRLLLSNWYFFPPPSVPSSSPSSPEKPHRRVCRRSFILLIAGSFRSSLYRSVGWLARATDIGKRKKVNVCRSARHRPMTEKISATTRPLFLDSRRARSRQVLVRRISSEDLCRRRRRSGLFREGARGDEEELERKSSFSDQTNCANLARTDVPLPMELLISVCV